MSSNRKLIAVMLSTLMLLSVVGPGLAAADEVDANANLSIDVDQSDGVVITVTDDGDGVEGATVNVSVNDENVTYADAGSHQTGENGTVSLETPDETVNVTINASYDNATASTTATLQANEGNDVFGQKVMDFVHSIIHSDNSNKTVGQQVAEFVTEHNPGNAPDHAGPSGDQGPPEHVGNNTDDQGPPEHAGPPEDDD